LRSGAPKSTNHSPRIFPDFGVRPIEVYYEHDTVGDLGHILSENDDDVFFNVGKCLYIKQGQLCAQMVAVRGAG
jgi:hypothetical protein